jgi:phosphoserine phosphatase RsbU/P
MNASGEQLWLDALSEVRDRSHLFRSDELATAVGASLVRLGIQTTIYLVDDEQRALRPVPHDGRASPEPVLVDGSLPGRVFSLVQSMPGGAPSPSRRSGQPGAAAGTCTTRCAAWTPHWPNSSPTPGS